MERNRSSLLAHNMVTKNSKRLGTGLDALLGSVHSDDLRDAASRIQSMDIHLIHANLEQPRSQFNEQALLSLKDSIVENGVLQPILVRKRDDGRSYQIIAGERRWRAAQLAGLAQIPAIECDWDDTRSMIATLVENLQRTDLNAIETAKGLQHLIERFGLTHQQAAVRLGYSRSQVSNLLRLLEADDRVQQALRDGHIEMGHARSLLSLNKPMQRRLLAQVVSKQLSVRQTEHLIKQVCQRADGKLQQDSNHPTHRVQADSFAFLEQQLQQRLQTQVKLSGSEHKGRLTIYYHSKEALNQIARTFLHSEQHEQAQEE